MILAGVDVQLKSTETQNQYMKYIKQKKKIVLCIHNNTFENVVCTILRWYLNNTAYSSVHSGVSWIIVAFHQQLPWTHNNAIESSTNRSSNSPSASNRHSLRWPMIWYLLLATPSYIKSLTNFGITTRPNTAAGLIGRIPFNGSSSSVIRSTASDFVYTPSLVTNTIELISDASRPFACSNARPTFDCNAANLRRPCGSQSNAKLTVVDWLVVLNRSIFPFHNDRQRARNRAT